ncbi:MAG TPA: response regulator [Alphaproteobacteria bacterium]
MRTILNLSAVSFLVVDDSRHMRAIIRYVLRLFGARTIREAEDGASALEVLASFTPDIVITNWLMAPVDGIELTQTLRRAPDSPCPTVPIVMISGHTEEARVAEARDAGVTEFLAKPMTPKALYMRIEEVILKPRRFVRTPDYVGPDRQRHGDDGYAGPDRRKIERGAEEPEAASASPRETAA